MAVSPVSRKLGSSKLGATKLYRTARRAVILTGLAAALVQSLPAQSAAPKKAIKGPRALGVVQLLPNGKARLIPVTILWDGEFYDASAYKAAPVPMALESGTVYEGIRTGVSQGLFTVTSALHGNNTWLGDGTWQTASAIAAAKEAAAKKRAVMSAPAPEPPEGPPVLRRASPKPKSGDDSSAGSTPSGPTSSPSSSSTPAASSSAPEPGADSNRPVLKRPATDTSPAASTPSSEPDGDPDRPVLKRPASETAPAASTPSPTVSEAQAEADPDRPTLKRGAPTAEELKKRNAAASAFAKSGKGVAPKSSTPAVVAFAPSAAQLIPAISDAAGPDPRPYAYSLKPEEELKLRKKILLLAADEVQAWAAQPESAGSKPAARTPSKATKARPPQPSFEDVQLHAFDLSNSNEPIVVMTATARMPVRPNTTSDLQYVITLVARDDMYGEVHKVFASVTDNHHFDVLSRLELIDAVDADGDGRGELLFRQVSDGGSAFVLYRVIGDRLWPLFQGTPGL